jgi:hypothetical protein
LIEPPATGSIRSIKTGVPRQRDSADSIARRLAESIAAAAG